jgi:hypothetical protein
VPQSQLYPRSVPEAPTFSPPGGTYSSTQQVAIRTSTPDAVVRYTLDGSDPTETSPILSSTSTLRVASTQLLRAQAWVPKQVQSEISNAHYIIVDSVVPAVQILTPAANSWSNAVSLPTGTASDGGSGIARVDVQLRRLNGDVRWTGSEWVNREFGLPTTLSSTGADVNWQNQSSMPTGANLPAGTYEWKAIAYDRAGNVGISLLNVSIDLTAPTLVIATPSNGATISDFSNITGTLRDAQSGLSRVRVQLRRVSDGHVWDGWNWTRGDATVPARLTGENWAFVAPAPNGGGLPLGANLSPGAYEIIARGFDRAGNVMVASVSVTLQTSSTSAAAPNVSVTSPSVDGA